MVASNGDEHLRRRGRQDGWPPALWPSGRRAAGAFAIVAALLLFAGGQPGLVSPLGTTVGTTVGATHDMEAGTILQAVQVPLVEGNTTTATTPAAPDTDENDKLPLLEIFTATWCPPCGPADGAIEDLLLVAGNESVEGPEPFIVLAYHPWPDVVGTDPFGTPEGNDRMRAKYDAVWFPTVVVDGIHADRPQTRSTDVTDGMRGIYRSSFTTLLADAEQGAQAPRLTMEAHLEGSDVVIKATVDPEGVMHGPLVVSGALWQDHVPFPAANGASEQRYVVREMLPPRAIAEDGSSETTTVEWRIRAPDGFMERDAGVTVFVETPWAADITAAGDALLAVGVVVGGLAFVLVATAPRWMPPRRRWDDPGRQADDDAIEKDG